MRVACVIPWRGGDEHREAHHRVVRDHLVRALPDATHIDADSGHDPFSRAGSRNHGVRAAQDADADVILVCDADTLPEPQPLHDALAAAYTDGLLHLPYTWYRGLSQDGTRRYLAGAFPDECGTDWAHQWATGGTIAITPAAWWAAGGMDETFTGWGFEDVAFRLAADALLGPTVKHPGTITHLWHPLDTALGSPNHVANAALCERYNAAADNADAIRTLIAERAISPQAEHAQ